MKITICLVFGLPAVGKTTFCGQLMNHPGHTSLNKYLFTYDDLMSEKLIFEDENFEGLWKSHRHKVFQNVENCIIQIKTGDYERNVFKELCTCFQNGSTGCDEHVLFIDDNFFYSSMRYAYYQLARKMACSFCQIFIKAPEDLDLLFKRNKNRKSSVPEETIRKMSRLFESPDPGLNHWEKNTTSFDCFDLHTNNSDWFSLKVFDFVNRCSLEIVPPVLTEEEIEERRLNRQKNLENYYHQCDQLLRKHVSKEMAIAKNEKMMNKNELKELAKLLNDRRKKYLTKIRDGNAIRVDEDEIILFDEKWLNTENEKIEMFFKECTLLEEL
ncbi:L-seryl-tRNA(Sec) kinase-like [Clytia hemisphaerica]|uniref:L-seryl-tRNA(Sec) kinase-like n=1 Tax=Clytia hemisphaerica TaxID=252671 RepID=UPI0034D41EA2|eukprot:TCONS_00065535-protein